MHRDPASCSSLVVSTDLIRSCCIDHILYTFHFTQWVKEEAPDILCLQETKCSENKLPAELQELPGLSHQYWSAPSDKEGYSGVGLLSRQCPLKVSYGIGESLLIPNTRALSN